MLTKARSANKSGRVNSENSTRRAPYAAGGKGETRGSLGFPYAPAGRFERPAALDSFDVERATAFGPAAPQRAGMTLVPESPVGPVDERNCLTLNVWGAPGGSEPRPVLVWFH